MSGHTKGPWKWDGEWFITDASGRHICEIHTAPDLQCYPSESSEDIANARLIAAAPDLLEALEECATDLMICSDNARDAAKTDHRWAGRWAGVADTLMRRVLSARAAIAKAKGETT